MKIPACEKCRSDSWEQSAPAGPAFSCSLHLRTSTVLLGHVVKLIDRASFISPHFTHAALSAQGSTT